ncbi:hypothetical protein [Halomicronema sp. CCY15110]|uniref:hypothetical protein n=1 Tax=Halomicronema sp. CCY15110 TaxID=2767773 RepID=UPI00194F6C8C|nr:hypothetical protein [Halomicronema sp. CCY15110]
MFSMKQILTGLVAGSLLAFGGGIVMGHASAQTADAEAFGSVGTDDNGADLFGDSSSPYDLILDAMAAPSMNAQEFFEYQNRVLGDEAQDFLQRRQEALQQQGGTTPEATEEITVDEEGI